MSEEFYKTLLENHLKEFYDEYRQDFPTESVINDVHQYMAERFENDGVPIKKGLISLLKYLKENHYKTIVATSSNRNKVDKILQSADIEKYFDDSISGNEVTKEKPNLEVFLKSCK